MRAELAVARADEQQAAERARELQARAEALESRGEQREGELKREIERLGAELAAASSAPDPEELLAPLQAQLAAAQEERAQAAQRESELRQSARGDARSRSGAWSAMRRS